MSSKHKSLTAKNLGLADDVKLSERYNNTKECFRTSSDRVLGYYVVPGGQVPTRIAPIYHAETWIRYAGHPHRLISSYEIGEYLNDCAPDKEPDHAGNALARIAAEALVALELHAARKLKRKPR